MAYTDKEIDVEAVVTPKRINEVRKVVNDIYMDEKIEKYIVDIVFATREPEAHGLKELAGLIEYGASPRASIYLSLAAKAYAAIRGKFSPDIEDVKAVAYGILHHRIVRNYKAEAEGITESDIIKTLL